MTSTKRPELGLRKLALFQHLGYVPHETQLVVHESRSKRRVVACGTRWGKSVLAAHETIAELLYPRERAMIWLVAPTYELTKRIAERVVMTLQTHLPHRVVKLDAKDRSITIANLGGGETVLRARSADRPVGLLGDSVDALIVDESAQIHERVWTEHLAPRLIDCDGSALLLSTPDGGGWFYDEFKRAKTDPVYAAWSFPTSANPRIDQELIEAERKRLPVDVFRAQYLAEFVGVPIIPCDVCHGPKRGNRTLVLFEGLDDLGTCPACERPVDADGETIVPLNRDGTEGEPRIIRIIGSPDEPPEMPGNPAS